MWLVKGREGVFVVLTFGVVGYKQNLLYWFVDLFGDVTTTLSIGLLPHR